MLILRVLAVILAIRTNAMNDNNNDVDTKTTIFDPMPLCGISPDDENLVYRSGIATLRSSTHRVKFSLKSRKHDPKPKDENGQETKTTWLPAEICGEDVFAYDVEEYNFAKVIISLLDRCCKSKIGHFRSNEGTENSDLSAVSLEDFVVPVESVWRTVNGGCCEEAQKILSDEVVADEEFLGLFDRFVTQFVVPYLKQRLISVGAVNDSDTCTFYCQRPPTLRLQPGPGRAGVKPHADSEYGHQHGELNFWVPLTDRELTGVDLWCESQSMANDYHRVKANPGEVISFHGSSCRHFVSRNTSCNTRVSMDFRIGVQGFFDPYWQMKGTNDDHGRKEIKF